MQYMIRTRRRLKPTTASMAAQTTPATVTVVRDEVSVTRVPTVDTAPKP
jgi:hypothetical protein